MKQFGILLVATLAFGCAGGWRAGGGLDGGGRSRSPGAPTLELETLPALGDPFPLPESAHLLMIASAQISPYRHVRVGGVLYSVASTREGKVAYIGTHDPGFRTPEGLSTASTLEEVTATGARTPWAEPGWAYHTELPSGWRAAFTVGCEMTGGPLVPGAAEAFFFRRD